MKIIVDPRSNYSYGSFYLFGLKELYGSVNIMYKLSPFKGLPDLGNDMRFVIINKNNHIKYFLHLNDSYKIKDTDYAWCDVYGCVNANFASYPKVQYPKLISLVPSFGIKEEKNIVKLSLNSLVCLFSAWHHVLNREEWNKTTQSVELNKWKNIKHFFSRRYKTWRNRASYSRYQNTIPSEDNYVFFKSTLWYSDEWNENDKGVNARRANFIRACKEISGLNFEGGLLADMYSSLEFFNDVVTVQREAFDTWLEKTKRSAFVFNTPAFWNCHGWKLGEYLALGKCIISTPLSNDLPFPLEHGVNIHFCEDSQESMREAIEYIYEHPEYRHKLEQGAKEYWETYGTPIASLKLLGIQ